MQIRIKTRESIDIKNITSDSEKFLKARIVGILECCAHKVRSTRKVVFLPCDFQPTHRMLKRKSHLPQDYESEDVYYQTLLYKYLVRPKELHNLTYIDLFRFEGTLTSVEIFLTLYLKKFKHYTPRVLS